MSVFRKFFSVFVVTAIAGLATYAAVRWLHASSEFILLASSAAVLIQVFFSLNYSKQIDADRKAAFKVVDKICKKGPTIKRDSPFSVLMEELEELFRETLTKERKVVENAADLICLVSTDGVILSANPAAKTVLGYTPEELVGKKLSDYRVADVEDNLNPLLGAAESIQKIVLENQFRKKDGSVIDLLWSAHWSATDNGLFCVAHDITERKVAEKLLKESEERVRLILKSLPAGVCVLGLSGEIKFINKTARQLCLSSDDEQWHGHARTIFKPCADPFTIDAFAEKMSSEQAKVMNSTAEEIPVEISLRNIDWEEKPACLVMFIDVSEKHAAEIARQQFLTMRDETLALRQKLMDMVVHDIRGPLQSLYSTHELIVLGVVGAVEEKIKTKLEVCKDDLKRIIRLINDLLKISRHEVTRLDLTLAEADIEQLIVQAVNSIHDLAREKSLSINTQTVSSSITVDSDRILQVLFNLLSNAIKFSPGSTTITVSSTSENGFVRVSVSDQGRGIPEGAETSIFLPYSQASWKDSVEKGGTGLGLSICRDIITEHGGSIGVANNQGGGADFWFTIPIA